MCVCFVVCFVGSLKLGTGSIYSELDMVSVTYLLGRDNVDTHLLKATTIYLHHAAFCFCDLFTWARQHGHAFTKGDPIYLHHAVFFYRKTDLLERWRHQDLPDDGRLASTPIS